MMDRDTGRERLAQNDILLARILQKWETSK